jgi:hypothetical protein
MSDLYHGGQFYQAGRTSLDGGVQASVAHYQRRIQDGGAGRIYGTTTIAGTGVPVSRRVRVYNRNTGALLDQKWSGEDGSFEFTGFDVDSEYMVLSFDHTEVYNAVIADGVKPEV